MYVISAGTKGIIINEFLANTGKENAARSCTIKNKLQFNDLNLAFDRAMFGDEHVSTEGFGNCGKIIADACSNNDYGFQYTNERKQICYLIVPHDSVTKRNR